MVCAANNSADGTASADRVLTESSSRLAHRTFSRWRSSQGHHANQLLQAELTQESKLVIRTLTKWRLAAKKIRHDNNAADRAAAFFIQREAVVCWKAALARRRQERWVEKRRMADIGGIFERELHTALVGWTKRQVGGTKQ